MIRFSAFICLPLFLILSACVQHRQLVSFNEGPAFESLNPELPAASVRLQPGDLVEIRISAPEPMAVQAFQPPGDRPEIYRLDDQGQLRLPLLGPVLLAGLSEAAAQDTLIIRLGRYIRQPVVQLRLYGFRFTVLGEVARPGAFTHPGDQLHLLEALGTAGDIGPYGNRQQILVIRQRAGKRAFARLNLHDRAVFDSPYFYLQPGDVVIVEPMKIKTSTTADPGAKILGWATPVLSFASLLAALLN
jgi:polysaccharide export outer membrane protein